MYVGLCRYESTATHVSVDVCIIKYVKREANREEKIKIKCKYEYYYFASNVDKRLLVIKKVSLSISN
jgi:hypothetical protein